MSMTDPIADLLTRIRNGIQAAKDVVEVPNSKLKVEIARILAEQGYIAGYETREPDPANPGGTLLVRLKSTESRQSVISGLKRVSTPGRRTYVDAKHIPKVLGGMGTAIVTTSKGVKTGHEARQEGVGGEVVAYVW